MIFHDQETAKMFRDRARTDLIDFVDHIAQAVRTAGNVDKASVRNHVESYMSELPLTVSLLLNRSGYVYPADDTGYADCVVYFDNSERGIIGAAIRNAPGALVGGITPDGAIHT